MKKTDKIISSLKFIDNQDMTSLELERLISELEDIKNSKIDEEHKIFEEYEYDKNLSLNSIIGNN